MRLVKARKDKMLQLVQRASGIIVEHRARTSREDKQFAASGLAGRLMQFTHARFIHTRRALIKTEPWTDACRSEQREVSDLAACAHFMPFTRTRVRHGALSATELRTEDRAA